MKRPLLGFSVLVTLALALAGCSSEDVANFFGLRQARFVYVSMNTTSMAGYSMDPSTGALTSLSGSPFPVASNVSGLPASNGRDLVFLPFLNPEALETFSVSSSGALSSQGVTTFPVGEFLDAAAVTPDGKYLILPTHSTVKAVEVLSIGSSGTLTQVAGSPFAPSPMPFPSVPLVSPDGRFLYVSNEFSTQINVFAIADNGALTEISGSPFTTQHNGFSMAMTRDGNFLYYISEANHFIEIFSRNASTGALTSIGAPFDTDTNGTLGSGWVRVDPTGQFLYTPATWVDASLLTHFGVMGFAVHGDGSLTPLTGSPWETPGTASANCIQIEPGGQFLYAMFNNPGQVFGFRIHTDGSLSPVPGSPVTTPPAGPGGAGCLAFIH